MAQARWEWRTFGPGVAVAAAALHDLEPRAETHSEEVYLLLPARLILKVRDGLLDLKQLLATDRSGLQQWWPVRKDPLPISATQLGEVCRLIGVEPGARDRDEYAADDVIELLSRSDVPVRAARVRKHRVRYDVQGCSAELTDLGVDDRVARTFAIEAEDADAVAASIRGMGLGDYRNTDYGTALPRILDGTAPRFAVVDVGTNSVKLHVAERAPAGGFVTVLDRAVISRLGEGLQETGAVSDTAAARTAVAIEELVGDADRLGAVALVAVGTAGLRAARNGDEVLDRLAGDSGPRIQVISGEEEAHLAYLAAVGALRATGEGLGAPGDRLAVFDTGGGSTQVSLGDGTSATDRFSVDLGAVRITERFGLDGPVSTDTLGTALEAIRHDLVRLEGRGPVDHLVGMGGGVTNMAAVAHEMERYDPEIIQGSVLTREEVAAQVERYRTRTADERRGITGLQPRRADVILAGACIVMSIMDALGVDRLTVSDRGLRHGVLLARFGSEQSPVEASR